MLAERPLINTMTIQFKMEQHGTVNLDEIRGLVLNSFTLKQPTRSSKRLKDATGEPREFKNAVQFTCTSIPNASPSVKVFKNGTLHVTGAKTFARAHRIANLAAREILGSSIMIMSHTLHMMNVMFKLQKYVNLEVSLENMKSTMDGHNEIISLNKQQHAAINYKARMPMSPDRVCTYLIFKSGKVLMNSIRSIDEIVACSDMLMLRIQDIWHATDALYIPVLEPLEKKKRGRKKKEDCLVLF